MLVQSSSYRIRGDGRALNDTLRTQAGEGQVVLLKLRHFTLLDTLFVVKDAHAERAMADADRGLPGTHLVRGPWPSVWPGGA